ncbi:hypothetical protein CRG98_032218, partial [Punica granatum]
MSRPKKKLSYISVPSQTVNSLSPSSLQSLLISPKKPKSPSRTFPGWLCLTSPRLWFLALSLVSLFGMLRLGYNLDPLVIPVSSYPCATATWSKVQGLVPREFSKRKLSAGLQGGVDSQKLTLDSHGFSVTQKLIGSNVPDGDHVKGRLEGQLHGIHGQSQALASHESSMAHLSIEAKDRGTNLWKWDQEQASSGIAGQLHAKVSPESWTLQKQSSNDGGFDSEGEFWKQPDGMGYRGCLEFSKEYRRHTETILKDRRKYLLVVASGGLNQQRNQIVDAVVIARILGAALVVPILQVNLIWGDESEFSDIFDLDQFKRVLADDVRVVSSLPSKHLRTRPLVDNLTPAAHISPDWIRARYLKKLERVGVLLLRGLDSRLSKDLPSDLQKLRCKAAFQALRFAPGIQELGNRLAERMRSKGPYLALHLRMEKD